MALPDKKERQIGRREMFTNPAYYAGSAAAALGAGVAAHNVGRAGGWRALRGGRLAATAGAIGAGAAGGFAGADNTLKRQNRARVRAGYPERNHFGRQKKSKKAVEKSMEYDSAKVDRAIRARRALKAGGLTALVGVPVAAGALTGVAAIGAKRDRDYKKKKKADVDKSLGLFARPMTMRRAKAAGRLARIKADNAAVGAARGAGRTARYLNTNATPLLVGGSIGGGAAVAGMQMSERRKMSKSYVNVSRGAGEGLQRLVRRSNALQAMKESADPAVAARGRMLDRRMMAGMKRRAAVQSGQAKPRVVKKSLPSALRQMSRKSPNMYKAPGTSYAGQRVAASQVGRLNPAAGRGLQASVGREMRSASRRANASAQSGRRGLLSPRRAAAEGRNSYRNPLGRV